MAGQIEREGGARRRQMREQRAPTVEIGAEAMDEHQRRAFALAQPLAVEPRPLSGAGRRLGSRRSLVKRDVERLHAAVRTGARDIGEVEAALAREAARQRRRAAPLAGDDR